MEKMKRVLALLLVFAMLMPNMTTIALAADTEEDSVEISTEPVVLAEEPEVTEVTEAATEAPTEPPTEATEAPVVETEPVVVETEPPVTEETMVATAETVEGSAVEEVGMVTETVTVTSQQDAVAEQVQHPVTAESCVEVIPDFGEDFENDFLFATYVEDQFLDNIPAKFGTAGRKRLYSEAAKYVYDVMKAQIQQIAAGEVTSTVIAIDNIADSFRFAWTKEDLGVSALVSNGAFTQAAQNALSVAMGAELDRIMGALLVDCPYDLYWYDKTSGVRVQSGISSTDGITVSIPRLTVSMAVVSGYQGGSQYTTTKELSKVKTAADNANMVVSQHRSKNFYEKLTAYKDYICSQVAYNEAAAKPSYTGGYGDPWQVIYVFDGNSTTNVVCEGYAKAFQYLCDLSDFENNTVESFLVSGYAGGPHMWNIVSIDGRNYMVDVTNSDPHEDPNWLRFGQDGTVFLTGAEGSIEEGYTFTNTYAHTLHYKYSYEVTYTDGTKGIVDDAIDLYGDDEDSILNLSDISYAEYLEQCAMIQIDRDNVTLEVEQTVQLTATVQPAELRDQIKWSVESEQDAFGNETDGGEIDLSGGTQTVISVDQNGFVTALNPGTDYVIATVTYGDKILTSRCRVDVTEKEQELFEFAAANVIMGNNLDMMFAIPKEAVVDWSGHYVRIVRAYADGREDDIREIPFAEWTSNNNYYVVTYKGLAAKEMTDTIRLTVHNAAGNAVSEPWVDSMRNYVMRQLPKNGMTTLQKTMMVDMLNYGSLAQDHFNYGEDDYANSQLTEEQKGYASVGKELVRGLDRGDKTVGSNLILESNIQFLVAFKGLTEDMSARVQFTGHMKNIVDRVVTGSEFGKSGGYYYVLIDDLVIADARVPITITIYNADGSVYTVCNESIEDYLARMSSVGELNAAVMKFADSAYAYLHRKD